MKAVIDGKCFNRIIESTKRFTAQNETKPIHMWIRLEFTKDPAQVKSIAVDGYKMSIESSLCLEVDQDFIVYVKPTITKAGRYEKFVSIELADNKAIVTYQQAETIAGFVQPKGEFLNWSKVLKDSEAKPATYKIGVNGDHLLAALNGARSSVGNAFTKPIIFEFRSPIEPILLHTGDGNVKMVLPVRTKL